MPYKLAEYHGDTLAVPQLVVSHLTQTDGDTIRAALYLLQTGDTDPRTMARAAAQELVRGYRGTTIIDTILCLDGTEVIGACMGSELTKAGYSNMNAHQTIYVVTPEHTTGSQLIFRENTAPMIQGKHVLVLAASVTTGYTVQGAVEAIRYYGGEPAGVTAIFATVDKCAGYPVASIFDPHDLPDYQSYDAHSCPWCKEGKKIDALVNSFGYSSL